jgi:outer membrane protein assembly factor BamB/tetratricopeptide (TPR) repeat protein
MTAGIGAWRHGLVIATWSLGISSARGVFMRCSAKHALWSVSLLVSSFAIHSSAQTQPAAPEEMRADGSNPNSLYGKDSTQGVYVRDSAVAVEKLALADHMKHLKEWGKSAEVYQEILQKFGDRVVPAQTDAANNIYQYTSVNRAVQERLAKWPKEGIDVYRTRYEAEAKAMLDSAKHDDVAKLHRIYALFFITDAAKAAGMRLIELHLEAGEFAAAAWLGDRLINLHPAITPDEKPRLLYLTALSYHLAGNDALAKSLSDALKKSFAEAKATIHGVEIVLADSLANELQAPAPFAVATAKDEWPMPFGSLDRARIPDVEGYGGARMVSVPVVMPKLRPIIPGNAAARNDQEQKNKSDRELGMMTGIMPVVDGSEMFFQDNARLYAVSLESGLPLPGWASTYDGERNGRYTTNSIPTPRNQQNTVALTEDSVLGVMGQADYNDFAMAYGAYTVRDTKLVCLDRRSGAEKWVMTPAKLPADQTTLRSLDFTGSPLVLGDSVFVVGRSGKPVQFEDCYVLCFELATGKFRWATYICSASGQQQMMDSDNGYSDESAHLAYASGRIYALSNLGALAAIDAYDGTIAWLNIYPRAVSTVRFPGQLGWSRIRSTDSGGNRPWQINPSIVSEGKVFVLPSDSKYLFIYDAGTGVEVKRIRLGDLGNADQLLSVRGSHLIVAGSKAVYALDWQKYDETKFDKYTMLDWPLELKPGELIRGRGFVTQNWVYIPTSEKLWRIDIKTGKSFPVYPVDPKKKWDPDVEGPGNVLVVPDHVILAGATSVDVYTDLQVVQRKLDAEVAAAPSDPEPRLRYAEMMFVSGRLDLALPKLDEAISLLGGIGAMQAGKDRDRVFTNAMTFAQKLQVDEEPRSREAVSGLYDRAAGAASTAMQQVTYRLRRAKFADSIDQVDLEVRLYQEILQQPALRGVSVTDAETGGASPAGAIAEAAISSAVDRAGKNVYAAFEQSATKEFDLAKSQGAAAMLEVAHVYPNASVAPVALIAAARALESAGEHRQATQVLRQAFVKYPEIPNRTEVLEALARNYLAIPGKVDIAVARLAQAAKLAEQQTLAEPIKLPDGTVLQNVTFAAALGTLQKYQSQQTSAALPDFRLPPFPTLEERRQGQKPSEPFLPEVTAAENVLAIVSILPDHRRLDRVVAFSQTGLAVYAVGQTSPLFTARSVIEQPKTAAWMGESLLVFTPTRVVMLQPNGDVAWQAVVQNLPEIDAENDSPLPVAVVPEDWQRFGRRGRRFNPRAMAQPVAQADAEARPEQISQARCAGDRVVFSTSGGRVVGLDLKGNVLWQSRPNSRPVDRLLATDDFVVFTAGDELSVQLCALDIGNGQPLYRRLFTREGQWPINIELSPDGKVVYLTQDQLCAKDLFEPGDKLTFAQPGMRRDNGRPAYEGAMLPDHLLVTQGRILVIAENGEFLHVDSLENGQMLRYTNSDGQELDMRLTTDAREWRVVMQSAGPHVYVIGQRATLVAYNIDRPEEQWKGFSARDGTWQTRDAIIGKKHLLVLDEPAVGVEGKASGIMRLNFYSRVLMRGRESGLNEYSVPLTDPSGIRGWQAVEGGLYYLSGDGKLHFLRGAKKDA